MRRTVLSVMVGPSSGITAVVGAGVAKAPRWGWAFWPTPIVDMSAGLSGRLPRPGAIARLSLRVMLRFRRLNLGDDGVSRSLPAEER